MARLAQVGVQVDETGDHPLAAHVDDANIGGEAVGNALADPRHQSVLEDYVRFGVKTSPGIDDPAASQTEIHSSGTP